jgi:uncharacterized protein with ATP-grasp and redox domains
MPVLCQLADPANYKPFDWDLMNHPEDLTYWIDLFASFPGNAERRLREDGCGGAEFDRRWAAFREEYLAGIEARRADPRAFGEITTITLCDYRQAMIDKHGFPDPFEGTKQRENEVAAGLYANYVAMIDSLDPPKRWEALLRGLFAGNLFDLGAPATIEMYNSGQLDFHDFLRRIPDRPWRIDDADALIRRFKEQPYRQVLIFVDNAGTDIILGVVPLARELARRGMRVVLAANESPALNDITIRELRPLLKRLESLDFRLSLLVSEGMIEVMSSGGDLPLIDLSRVSEECNTAAADSDLIVLEGMGRGVESNWRQQFKCDVWRVALLKDACVTRWLGAELFDPVCRFASA